MNRRTLLTSLFKPNEQQPHKLRSIANSTGLTAYTGTWDASRAAHLLRRAMFAPNFQQIETAVQEGLSATLDRLFNPPAMPNPPVNNSYSYDTLVPIGSTWVDADYSASSQGNGKTTKNYRVPSLYAWTANLLRNEAVSIREKMTLFWHNHFPTEGFNNPNASYHYINLLREYALGNFRELTERITVNPAMLHYLNGNTNSADSPNENYARELFELFTIGKGPITTAGDYTHYTEGDIAAAAKVLTGWRITDFANTDQNTETTAIFRSGRHDKTDKQFSQRLGNAVISNNEENEYKDLIGIIFQQAEVARFICRKFYRWFVYYDIDADTESNIIQPLADRLISDNFNVAGTLRMLLESEHFFAADNIGVMIKNPYDFVMSVIKPTGLAFPTDPATEESIANSLLQFTELLQMKYYEPPSVAGWKAYYQEPQYYRIWINAVTFPFRFQFNRTILGVPEPIRFMGFVIQADVLALVDDLFAGFFNGVSGSASPYEVEAFIRQFALLFLPKTLEATQISYFKEILIPGLPDFEWSVEFDHYQQNLDDDAVVTAMANKVRSFVLAMIDLPEFQLM